MHKKRKKKKFLFNFILFLIIVIGIGFIVLKSTTTENNYLDNARKEQPTRRENKITLLKDKDVKDSLFKKYYEKAQKLVTTMTTKEKVGQLFLVRYNQADVEYLNNFYPGGYILFARDIEDHTKESLKQELKHNQEISKYPLIIGVDEEGGYVTRVSRFRAFRNEKFKSPKAYYEAGGLELLKTIEEEKAKLLTEVGFNLNLAPVADVSTNEDDFIYNRSFGYDAKTTANLISQMVTYANNENINSCLKHFPGYGNNVDTHTGIAMDNRSYDNFLQNDFIPFKAGIEAKVPSILVSHNIINSMDPDYPASLSSKVIKELRSTLGFTGIIMTDDLAMDAVASYVTDKKAATLAINAGNDMIITSDFIGMYNEVLESVENKIISEETLNKAVLRITAWKYYSNLFNNTEKE